VDRAACPADCTPRFRSTPLVVWLVGGSRWLRARVSNQPTPLSEAAGRLEGHGPGRQIGAAHLRRDSQTCAPVASESSPEGLLISASARASSASTSSWTPDLPSSVLSSGMGCESSEASPGSASSDPGDIDSGTNRIVPLVDGTMLRTVVWGGAPPHLRP
jgi:hypothetical protein